LSVGIITETIKTARVLLLLHHSLTHPLAPELCHLTPRACARGRVSAIFATAKSICANNKSVSTAGIALSLSKHCLPNGHLYVCAAAEDQGVEAWAAAFIDGAAGGLTTTGGGGPRTRIIRRLVCARTARSVWVGGRHGPSVCAAIIPPPAALIPAADAAILRHGCCKKCSGFAI